MTLRTRRKQKTYEALLDAALTLLDTGRAFSSLSLREVTREAGVVPTAFYRHFEEMDDLGLGLVEQSSAALRQMMREARSAPLPAEHLIRGSIKTFFDFVRDHRSLFLFLVRERSGGSARVRQALSTTLRLFIADLATDLARMPPLARFATSDIQMLADLIVNTVFATVEEFLEPPAGLTETEVLGRVERQLRLILLGASQWRSDHPSLSPETLQDTARAS